MMATDYNAIILNRESFNNLNVKQILFYLNNNFIFRIIKALRLTSYIQINITNSNKKLKTFADTLHTVAKIIRTDSKPLPIHDLNKQIRALSVQINNFSKLKEDV